MKIILNGAEIETKAETLEQLMEEQNFTQSWLASAVNSNLIKHELRSDYILQENDKIEILSPMQGG